MITRKIVHSNKFWIGGIDTILHLADVNLDNVTSAANRLRDVTTLCRRILFFPNYVHMRSFCAIENSQNEVRRCPVCASRGSFDDVLLLLNKELQAYYAENERASNEAGVNRMWGDVGDKVEQMVTEEWRIAALNGEPLPVELATYGTLLNFFERNIPRQVGVRFNIDEDFVAHGPNHEEG